MSKEIKEKPVSESTEKTKGKAVAKDKMEPAGTTKVTEYAYGDLAIKCGVCGHEQIIDTNVKGGITIVLPTTKEHKLQLVCEECKKSDMSIYFLDAADPPKEEEVVEEDKTKEAPEVKPEDVKLTVVKEDEGSDEPKEDSK